MHTLNLSDAISASWVWRLVFMMRAYWGSGLETQAKGLKSLKRLVFFMIFHGFLMETKGAERVKK